MLLYPRDGIAKQEIAGYYRDIAPVLVPLMIDRPVVVQRWVDGIDEFDWYQHRMPPRAPDYLRAAWVDDVRRIVIENADALLWMTNQAGLTYHGFGSRLATLAEPDWAMLDLDPGDRTTWWEETIEVALAIRRMLELLELPSVVKTSGQRGLHILVPLAPGHTFAQAEDFGRGIAELLVRLLPDKVTIENEKDKRRGRLLLDHKQFLAKTLVLHRTRCAPWIARRSRRRSRGTRCRSRSRHATSRCATIRALPRRARRPRRTAPRRHCDTRPRPRAAPRAVVHSAALHPHDLLDVIFRWAHLIAGIMWVGNSMLFNWMDRNLQKDGTQSRLSQGKIFMVHSGAFYDASRRSSSSRVRCRRTSTRSSGRTASRG